MNARLTATVLGAALMALGAASPARAQFDEYARPQGAMASPEWFAFELRVGPYQPDGDASFDAIFGSDDGLLLESELDVLLLRIPYVGFLGIGGTIGWAHYSAGALQVGTNARAQEETTLTLIPMSLLGSLRIDVLARELGIPFAFVGKLGMSIIPWDAETGGHQDGSGVTFGLRWGAQLALELDFFEPRTARALDEEWGINHSYLFVELFGSLADSPMPVGDHFTWVVGLGFTL